MEFSDLKNDLFKDKEIKKFCEENKIPDSIIEKYFSSLSLQQDNNLICAKCCGKGRCQAPTLEQTTLLIYENNKIKVSYQPCKFYNNRNNMEVLTNENRIYDYGNEEVYQNKERLELLQALNNFSRDYSKNGFSKGIYLHGEFGTGKTFILYKFAEVLASSGYKVIFIYFPELVRMVKAAISNGNLDVMINKIKNIDILFIDDIGSENNTNFIRDEILGVILDYRMCLKKPVFMTSNLDINLLFNHLSETSIELDKLKASRIIERIKYLMNVIKLEDKNYRL